MTRELREELGPDILPRGLWWSYSSGVAVTCVCPRAGPSRRYSRANPLCAGGRVRAAESRAASATGVRAAAAHRAVEDGVVGKVLIDVTA